MQVRIRTHTKAQRQSWQLIDRKTYSVSNLISNEKKHPYRQNREERENIDI